LLSRNKDKVIVEEIVIDLWTVVMIVHVRIHVRTIVRRQH